MNTQNYYRPDIDGLRAIAILSVLGFHAFPEVIKNGFIGVDVFFIISGFLITHIILKGLDTNQFSVLDFYARRIKRIFPALIVMLAACLAIGWLILLPHEYQALGKDTQYSTTFIANIRLYKDTGYFDVEALRKPLLHLWSLAVEEQFYILWPFLMFFLFKKRYFLFSAIICFALISFTLNVFGVQKSPEYSFYLPHTRFWELLLGSVLAYYNLSKLSVIKEYHPWNNKNSAFFKNSHLSSLLGISFILMAMLFLANSMKYPGAWALLPTVGAFLVIAAGPQAWLNKKILAHPIMVYIGLISYPLYLWHWPLLSFAKYLKSDIPDWKLRLILIAASFGLAILSYHLLEKPIRKINNKMANLLLLMMLMITFTASFIAYGKIEPASATIPKINNLEAAVHDWDFPGPDLQLFRYENMKFYQLGHHADAVLFFGDSNMQQYTPRIHKIITDGQAAKTAIFATRGGCPPIPNVYSSTDIKCANFPATVLEYAKNPQIKSIVISAQWLRYISNPAYYYEDATTPRTKMSEGLAIEKTYRALENMLKTLQQYNKKIYLVLNIPVGESFDPIHMANRNLRHPGRISVPTELQRAFYKETHAVSARLQILAEQLGIEVIDPRAVLCVENQCLQTNSYGEAIYRDTSHLRKSYVRDSITFLDDILLK